MADSPAERPKWSLKKKLLIGVALPLLLLLGMAIVFDGFGQGRLSAAMRQARAGGGPVTFAEIEAARKKWPEGQNGADILVKLEPELSVLNVGSAELDVLPTMGADLLPPLGRRLSAEALQAAEAELKRLEPELTAIDRLKEFQGGRFPLTYAACPFDTLLSHLANLRLSVRLKSSQTMCRIMAGDNSRLVDDVTVIERHGRLLADEPMLISSLVGLWCDQMALDEMQRALGLTTLTQEQLEQLDALAAGMEARGRLWWGVRGERAGFIGGMDYLRQQGNFGSVGPGWAAPSWLRKAPAVRGFLMQDEAAGLRLFNRLAAAADDSRKAREVGQQLGQELRSLPIYQPLTRILMPSLTGCFDRDLRLEASIRTVRAGLAVERYRLDTGRFPPSLEALTPKYLKAVPTDPFDDRPLRYRLDESGAVIYSVGEDLTDDGGQVEARCPSGTPVKDTGFVLLPPEQRGLPATQPASKPSWRTTMRPSHVPVSQPSRPSGIP